MSWMMPRSLTKISTALRGVLRPAGDRRIQIVPAGRLQLLGETSRHVWIHRSRRQEDAVLRHGFGDAILAEQDRLGLRGIDDDTDDDIGALGGFGRRLGADAALRHEPR